MKIITTILSLIYITINTVDNGTRVQYVLSFC